MSMKLARAPQLSGKHGLGIQLRVGAKDSHRALLVVADVGDGLSDRRESRRLRDAAEQTVRQARREGRRRQEEAQRRVMDGAARKAFMPGLAFTLAITTGVVKLAEGIHLLRSSSVKLGREQGVHGTSMQTSEPAEAPTAGSGEVKGTEGKVAAPWLSFPAQSAQKQTSCALPSPSLLIPTAGAFMRRADADEESSSTRTPLQDPARRGIVSGGGGEASQPEQEGGRADDGAAEGEQSGGTRPGLESPTTSQAGDDKRESGVSQAQGTSNAAQQKQEPWYEQPGFRRGPNVREEQAAQRKSAALAPREAARAPEKLPGSNPASSKPVDASSALNLPARAGKPPPAGQPPLPRSVPRPAIKAKTRGGAIGPFGVAMYGDAGSTDADERRRKAASDSQRSSSTSETRSSGNGSSSGSDAAAAMRAATASSSSGTGRGVHDGSGGGSGGGGSGGDSDRPSSGSEGAGNGGRMLLLLVAAMMLGAGSGFAVHEKQLGARIARFFRAGMAGRVVTVFVALSIAQGAVAQPSIALAAAVAAAATWGWLEITGSQAQDTAQD